MEERGETHDEPDYEPGAPNSRVGLVVPRDVRLSCDELSVEFPGDVRVDGSRVGRVTYKGAISPHFLLPGSDKEDGGGKNGQRRSDCCSEEEPIEGLAQSGGPAVGVVRRGRSSWEGDGVGRNEGRRMHGCVKGEGKDREADEEEDEGALRWHRVKRVWTAKA